VIAVDGPDVGAVTDDLLRSLRAANRAVGRDLANVARKAQGAAIRSSGQGSLSGMRVKLGVKTKVFAGTERVTVDLSAAPRI
jgi:hypothetical protein